MAGKVKSQIGGRRLSSYSSQRESELNRDCSSRTCRMRDALSDQTTLVAGGPRYVDHGESNRIDQRTRCGRGCALCANDQADVALSVVLFDIENG